MSNETWIEIAKWLGQLAAAALGGWVTARYAAKYSRTAETPAEKQPSRTQLLLRRIGSFMKRNWPGFILVPATYAWPFWSFVNDLIEPPEDVRVHVMWVALDVLTLSLISAFWISLFVSHLFADAVVRNLQTPDSDGE